MSHSSILRRVFGTAVVLFAMSFELLTAAEYDVNHYGAKGDGSTLDTDSINKAIAAAHDAGGGTVSFPAGTYLSASIHLQSN